MSSVDTDSDTEDHEVVRVNGCDIYYYGEVDRENALEFLDVFKKLEVNLLKKAIELPGYTMSTTHHRVPPSPSEKTSK